MCIRERLDTSDGVEIRDVNIIYLGADEVEHEPSIVSRSRLSKAISKAGYEFQS